MGICVGVADGSMVVVEVFCTGMMTDGVGDVYCVSVSVGEAVSVMGEAVTVMVVVGFSLSVVVQPVKIARMMILAARANNLVCEDFILNTF